MLVLSTFFSTYVEEKNSPPKNKKQTAWSQDLLQLFQVSTLLLEFHYENNSNPFKTGKMLAV